MWINNKVKGGFGFLQVELIYKNGDVNLMVDNKTKTAELFGKDFKLCDKITMGSGVNGKSSLGNIYLICVLRYRSKLEKLNPNLS